MRKLIIDVKTPPIEDGDLPLSVGTQVHVVDPHTGEDLGEMFGVTACDIHIAAGEIVTAKLTTSGFTFFSRCEGHIGSEWEMWVPSIWLRMKRWVKTKIRRWGQERLRQKIRREEKKWAAPDTDTNVDHSHADKSSDGAADNKGDQ